MKPMNELVEHTADELKSLDANQPEIQPNLTAEHQATAPVQETPASSPKERNLSILRERAERAERELQHERQLRAQQPNYNMPPVNQYQQPFDESSIGDDDYIEGKHLKKIYSQINSQLQEQQRHFENESQRIAIIDTEKTLRSRYKDLDVVLTPDNIKNLEALYPEDAAMIAATPNIKARAILAYNAIKERGLGANDYEQQDKKIQENKAKYKNSATVAPQYGDSPLSRAGDYDRRILTDERRAQLREQVKQAKMLR